MTLRLAGLNDISEIMELVNGVVPLMNAAGNFQWDASYPNPAVFESDVALGQLWLCEISGVIAGLAAITNEQEPEYAQVGWDPNEDAIVVHRLVVGIDHRGKGVAGLLMNKAEAVAIERFVKILRVDTSSVNAATQKLFPGLGYTFAGEITLRFRPGQTFFCYEKRIG